MPPPVWEGKPCQLVDALHAVRPADDRNLGLDRHHRPLAPAAGGLGPGAWRMTRRDLTTGE